MIVSRRGVLTGLIGLIGVLVTAGCTAPTPGTAQPEPTPPRKVAPERIQFRMVVTDGTGGITLSDHDGQSYQLGPVLLDGTQVTAARAAFQQEYATWVVNIVLTPDGAAVFGQVTGQHVGEQLAIVVDDAVVSAPTIQGAITGGTVQISAKFDRAAATALADRITGR